MAVHEAPGIVLGSDKQAAFVAPGGGANTRLGLHVTSDELAIWQARASSGPYKTANDVATDSPGDWDRIVTNKNTFGDGSGVSVWSGPAGSSSLNATQNDPPAGAEKVRDAAFYAMVQGDSTVAGNVRTWLLSQAGQSQLDFSNRTLWTEGSTNPESVFSISEWVNRLVYAMDYIEILNSSIFTSGQRTTMENWFLAFADFTDTNINTSASGYWADRVGGDYTAVAPDSLSGEPYFGSGMQYSRHHRSYNNRRIAVMCTVLQIAVKFNSTTHIDSVKLWVQEFLKFGWFPAGHTSDFLRGFDNPTTSPDAGINYAFAILGNTIDIADTLARDGDTSLYTYSTTAGYRESTDGSTAKTINFAMTTMSQYWDHTYARYAATTSGEQDEDHRIDSRKPSDTSQWAGELSLARGNLWFDSSYYKGIIERTGSGTVAYSWGNFTNNGPYSPWMGHSGQYPGVLFMWGQLEGTVDPYP